MVMLVLLVSTGKCAIYGGGAVIWMAFVYARNRYMVRVDRERNKVVPASGR